MVVYLYTLLCMPVTRTPTRRSLLMSDSE